MGRTPDGVGYRHRDTEVAAAYSMPGELVRSIKDQCLKVLGSNPSGLTSDEIGDIVGLEKYSIRRRVSDLVNDDLVEDSGERRRLKSGRQGIVWAIKRRQLELI
jgi:predicted ArsR family transcriptional regulator